MSASTITVRQHALILSFTRDWDDWYARLKAKSIRNKVFAYLDQSLVVEPPQPIEPERPTAQSVAVGATYLTLDADQRAMYNLLLAEYTDNRKRFERLNAALNEIADNIETTISRDLLLLVRDKGTPYSMLRALKGHLAPNDTAKEIDVLREYTLVCKGPQKNQSIETWLTKWDKAYRDAVNIELADVTKDRAQYAFLVAISSYDKDWAREQRMRLTRASLDSTDLPTVHRLIEEFNIERKVNPVSSRDTSFATATLNGEGPLSSSSASHPSVQCTRPCLCKEKHWFRECKYICPALRLDTDKLDPEIQALVDKKIKNGDERFQGTIAKARTQAEKKSISAKPVSTPIASFSSIHQTVAFNSQGLNQYRNHWFIDSASTAHITNNNCFFTAVTPTKPFNDIISGTGSTPVEAIGTVILPVQTPSGNANVALSDVLYAPGYATNVLSLAKLIDKGYQVDFTKNHVKDSQGTIIISFKRNGPMWIISKNKPSTSTVALATTAADLPGLSTPPLPVEISSAPLVLASRSSKPKPKLVTDARTIHDIYGHISAKAIENLPRSTTGVEITTWNAPSCNAHCETCAISKATRIVSRRTEHTHPVTKPFERISVDMIHHDEGYNNDFYTTHLVCTVTGFQMAASHAKASDSREVVEEFLNIIENNWRFKVKFCKTDDFRSDKFDTILRIRGIIREPSASNTQAQNGPAERSGRVIVTTSRCLLQASNLPLNLWPEAIPTAVALINETPTERLKDPTDLDDAGRPRWRTPWEMVFNTKPDGRHRKPYGCRAYSLIHGIPKLQKMKPRALIGYLVGYDGSNIYRIWIPTKQIVIRTRDVTFDILMKYNPETSDHGLTTRDRIDDFVEVIEPLPVTTYYRNIYEDTEDEVIEFTEPTNSDDLLKPIEHSQETGLLTPSPTPSNATEKLPNNTQSGHIEPLRIEQNNIPLATVPHITDATTTVTTDSPVSEEINSGPSGSSWHYETGPERTILSDTIIDGKRRRKAAHNAFLSTTTDFSGLTMAYSNALSFASNMSKVHIDKLPSLSLNSVTSTYIRCGSVRRSRMGKSTSNGSLLIACPQMA